MLRSFSQVKLAGSLLLSNIPRVVTKISSCRVNTTSRRGIKQQGISFGSIFLLFSNKSSRGPPALNDSPDTCIQFTVNGLINTWGVYLVLGVQAGAFNR